MVRNRLGTIKLSRNIDLETTKAYWIMVKDKKIVDNRFEATDNEMEDDANNR